MVARCFSLHEGTSHMSAHLCNLNSQPGMPCIKQIPEQRCCLLQRCIV